MSLRSGCEGGFQGCRVSQFHWIEDLSWRKAEEKGERAGWESGSTAVNIQCRSFNINPIVNVKAIGKDDRARGKATTWGCKKTYSLMNWKRLIFNMVICYAVML